MRTSIKTTTQTIDRLNKLKLTQGESHENIILRLIEKHKGSLENKTNHTSSD